jgi:hypothetical protein
MTTLALGKWAATPERAVTQRGALGRERWESG